MNKINKIAVSAFAVSALMVGALSTTAIAAPKDKGSVNYTMKGSLPKGKPFQYLNDRIDSLEATLNLLIGRVSSLEDWQARAQVVLDKLERDVVKNSAAIALLQAQIQDVNDILSTKQDIIDGECPDNQYLYKVSPTDGLVCRSDIGSNGLAVLTVEFFADIATSSTADVAAICPTGSVPTGGSYNAAPEQTVNSASITATGYNVNVTNSTTFSLPISVTATCLAVNP